MSNSVHCGPGVWKLNTQHLKDQCFILMVTQFWKSWWADKRAFFKLSVWWDAGKASPQNLICSFPRKKASTFQKCVSFLECPSFFLQRRAEEKDVARMLADTKSKLEDAHRQQARGCRVRANVQWAKEGEPSTAYFYNLERRKGPDLSN